ncbi:MAG: hypothetical protein JW800_05650 [Candidatus Omnitrophica bacterium]|nr:hypothetical protein [Candidatus Omnitrophota bacterium]
MKRVSILLLLLVFSLATISAAMAQDSGHGQPAPNSGDCVPDGSGYEKPNGPNNTGSGDSGKGWREPAPNAGDGVPDGPGR